ncbi:MAG: hypothetical protein ACTTHG_04635 [Treponemataceae bacterium]
MKNKLFAIIVFTLIILMPSCTREQIIKGDGNPDFSKFIDGDVKNETTLIITIIQNLRLL